MEWRRDGSAKEYKNKKSCDVNLQLDTLSYIRFQVVMDLVAMSTYKFASLLFLFVYFHPHFIQCCWVDSSKNPEIIEEVCIYSYFLY